MAATTNITSARSTLTSWDPFINFVKWYTTYDEKFKTDGEEYANMAFGNPQDRPLPEFVAALRRQLTKVEAPDTFAYKFRFPESVDAVVDALERTRGIQNMDPADVTLTNGALSALSLCLFVLADPGDEALYISPSYFLYKPMMEFAGLIPVAVAADPNKNFDLDVEAIRNALTPKTRVIIINSPNNPTGKIYPPATLEKLAQVLRQENQRRIRQTTDSTDDRVVYKPIMVISDEAYCRIIFDQDSSSSSPQFVSVAQVYEYSVMVYTWGKTLTGAFGAIWLHCDIPTHA